jgi:hypothetical protein
MSKATGVAPGFLLRPAREYEWQLEKKIQIRVPLKGSIQELLNDTDLPTGMKIVGDDEFSIFEDNLLLLWEVIRVLFAQGKYPSLEDNQSLNIVALEFEDDEAVLHGEVIKSIG